jgi:biotin operon repressor
MQSFELPDEPIIKQHRPQDLRKYSIVPIRAAADRRIRPAAMRVLLTVCSYANRAGLCWPSHENVGKALGVSRQAAGRQIRILRELGYFKVVKNHSYGKTAQIIRVVYDETLSNSNLMDAIKFEDLPPTLQAWKEKETIELLNQDKEPFNNVAVTAKEQGEDELGLDELLSMWKSACNQANIARIITPEDRAAAASLVTYAVSKASFERVLAEVFEAWRVHRREPPHRLAWFVQRLRQEPTLAPSPIAPTDVGT